MFGWIGKNAVDGALERFKEAITRTDWKSLPEKIPVLGFLAKVYPDIQAGYDSMSGTEKADFWKSVMITAAKIGMKV